MNGLAATMVYGNGEGQNTQHYYAGTVNKPKKARKMAGKKKKCVKRPSK